MAWFSYITLSPFIAVQIIAELFRWERLDERKIMMSWLLVEISQIQCEWRDVQHLGRLLTFGLANRIECHWLSQSRICHSFLMTWLANKWKSGWMNWALWMRWDHACDTSRESTRSTFFLFVFFSSAIIIQQTTFPPHMCQTAVHPREMARSSRCCTTFRHLYNYFELNGAHVSWILVAF